MDTGVSSYEINSTWQVTPSTPRLWLRPFSAGGFSRRLALVVRAVRTGDKKARGHGRDGGLKNLQRRLQRGTAEVVGQL